MPSEQRDVTARRFSNEILDALDLPPALHAVQNAYWEKRREWNARRAAYLLVVSEVIEYVESREAAPEEDGLGD